MRARGAAEEIGSGLARGPVAVDVDGAADPHFALSGEARDYLRENRAHPVTVVTARPTARPSRGGA